MTNIVDCDPEQVAIGDRVEAVFEEATDRDGNLGATTTPVPTSGGAVAMERTSFHVEELDTAELYKLTTGLIIPRLIGWIGTQSADGVPPSPILVFNAVATNPPVLMFSTGVFHGVIKDSLKNIRETGEFTASLVDHDLAVAMNDSSATFLQKSMSLRKLA